MCTPLNEKSINVWAVDSVGVLFPARAIYSVKSCANVHITSIDRIDLCSGKRLIKREFDTFFDESGQGYDIRARKTLLG
ncbi:hypothetical protein [Alkanindiges illinoisensis]|uniref:hypothetical protein n=1 Tax=Alkanindiges illinoisensis TaxID=197183 RepID=UPI00047CE7B9|nr:hypothetical protein [Alkanindiges illinoisensis]